jgi:hypothetical protein
VDIIAQSIIWVMFTPTITTFRRGCYARLRDLGASRDRAAALSQISYSSARRLDAEQRRCGMCGQPTNQREDDDT